MNIVSKGLGIPENGRYYTSLLTKGLGVNTQYHRKLIFVDLDNLFEPKQFLFKLKNILRVNVSFHYEKIVKGG